jgi:flagellar basal body-associated protein FliL
MLHKSIKILIVLVITLIVLFLLAYGVSKSSFYNLKKYDEQDSSANNISRVFGEDYTRKVSIKGPDIANLGDFTVNISEDRKLIVNISFKFKNYKDNSWSTEEDVEQEILRKGDVLRSVIIDIITGSSNASVTNKIMKARIVKGMNKYLSKGEVKEIYFNKFITQ